MINVNFYIAYIFPFCYIISNLLFYEVPYDKAV